MPHIDPHITSSWFTKVSNSSFPAYPPSLLTVKHQDSRNHFGGPRHGTKVWCHAQLPASQVLPVGAHQTSSHLVMKHKNLFHTSAEMHFLYFQSFTLIPLSEI